jgi:hypothetical protein
VELPPIILKLPPPAEHKIWCYGENLITLTQSVCESKIFVMLPVYVFQILIVLSRLPDATNCPSGENETHLTFWV